MGRMIFDLTDEDRASLEAIRKHRGLRSHAETLRHLIREVASGGLSGEAQSALKAHLHHVREAAAIATVPIGPVRPKPGEMLKKR